MARQGDLSADHAEEPLRHQAVWGDRNRGDRPDRQVNGHFGDAAWTPIRYVNRSYSRTVLAGLYRAADVAMVTPLRDGMNFVAKEYLAAQDPDDPGVLVLSQFAGAAKELDGR